MNRDFTLLYQKYKEPIFSYIYYLSRDYTEAEEICQDVFLKVYLNIAKFEGRSSFKTWIYCIAKNTFLEFKRKTKKEILIEEFHTIENSFNVNIDTPEDHVLQIESQDLIKKVLARMNDKYRNFIILRDIQELSYQEISEITGIKLNTVKVNIYRARREFQSVYKELEGM